METKIVEFPKSRKTRGPMTDTDHVKAIKAAHRKLCKVIDEATKAGLKVELSLDAQDTYGGGLVRSRDLRVSRAFR